MSLEHMILDAEHKLVPATLMEWAMFFENHAARVVAQTDVGDVEVSTVFLGIDHSFIGGPPLWFETMVFTKGSRSDERGVWRYTTWDEAVAGHGRIVAALTEGREP